MLQLSIASMMFDECVLNVRCGMSEEQISHLLANHDRLAEEFEIMDGDEFALSMIHDGIWFLLGSDGEGFRGLTLSVPKAYDGLDYTTVLNELTLDQILQVSAIIRKILEML